MLVSIGLIAVLLLLLFFFSTAETALTVASRPLMHQKEIEGDPRAARVNRLLHHKEKLVGVILLGNTVVAILASSLATSVGITLFGDEAGVAYVSAIMTVLVLVFCEIMPKSLALIYANGLALAIAPVMRLLVLLFGPVIQAIQWLVFWFLRPFGVRAVLEADSDAAMTELRGAIDIHAAEEEVQHERKMLRSILDLNNVTVSDVMFHRKKLIGINADLPVVAIMDQVTASPYTRMPVWRDQPDNIIGVLHAKALLRAVRARGGQLDGLDIVTLAHKPWFIPENTTLLDQLQAFRQRREHFALVVDEYGTLQGGVTLEDIIEEIVGDISDEHDIQVSGVRPQPDGSYLINGEVTLRDLNREFDWRLPDEQAATIAGLLLYEARMIPDVGQVFLFHNFRFDVLKRVRNQITLVRVTPAQGAGR